MYKIKILSVIIFLFAVSSLNAQYNTAYDFLLYPRSIAAAAIGEQGVASGNPLDAMQYNPANLGYQNGTTASYFRRPWNIGLGDMPITSVSILSDINEKSKLGLEYNIWNLGEFVITNVDGEELGKENYYDASIAANYALLLNDNFSIGAQMRYVWTNSGFAKANNLIFSAGLLYKPEILNKRLSLGFSLMNFGTKAKYESDNITHLGVFSPLPSHINLGINSELVTNDYYDLDLSLGITKPLIYGGKPTEGETKTSFSALFSDWDDFPNDLTGQIGIGYKWKPVNLGKGFSYIQEMYAGYVTAGKKYGNYSFFTHGFNVGLQYSGIEATIGYAGQFHNNDYNYYPFGNLKYPSETFQFTVSTDWNILGNKTENNRNENPLEGIIISAGYSHGVSVGRMNKEVVNVIDISNSMKSNWSINADFYTSKDFAILSGFEYSKMVKEYRSELLQFFYGTDKLKIESETVSLSSGLRYHPVENFHPFFVQGSLGIIRINPTMDTMPKYYYQTFTDLKTGCVIDIANSGFVVIPSIGFKTIFMETLPNAEKIGGYNQFEFGLNLGYKL